MTLHLAIQDRNMETRREPSDAELVLAVARRNQSNHGDSLPDNSTMPSKKAFEILFCRHSGYVLGFLEARLHHDPLIDAEDLVQETFFTLWIKATTYQEPYKVRRWLAKIAWNKAVSALRRKGSHRRWQERAPEQRRPNRDPLEALVGEENRGIIREIIDSLAETYRAPVRLSVLEQMTDDEIAKHLEAKSNTIRTRICRGKKLLREKLARHR